MITENYTLPEEFVELKFKLRNYSFTKININPNNIHIYPHNKKLKINVHKKALTNLFFAYNVFNHNLNFF